MLANLIASILCIGGAGCVCGSVSFDVYVQREVCHNLLLDGKSDKH